MKKLLLSVILLSLPAIVKADTPDSTLYVNLGTMKLYVPVASGVDVSYLWDLNNKQSLVGGETPVITYQNFTLTGGAVTGLSGNGAPFARIYYSLPNPVGAFWSALASFHAGAFVGKDFSIGGRASYLYGIGASKKIW